MLVVDEGRVYEDPGKFYLHPAVGLDELTLMVMFDREFEVKLC